MPMTQQSQLSLERARVRDLLRYYKPKLKRQSEPTIPEGSVLEICGDPSSLFNLPDRAPDSPSPALAATLAAAPAAEAADDAPDDSQLLTHDPTLTAFAQLGAFRLKCQRSFISLMDHENQYILAEATRSVSLNDQKVSDEGDEVYLGARVLDMIWGVCPNTIQVFTAKDGSLNVETELVVANPQCYVMSDMSAIENFKTRPYVAGWPHMRFYAEVPIHSPTGFVIGTYCVVDDKPRNCLDQKGLDALIEISSAIMKHLELIQMQHQLQRAGEMVKGLGIFVEGKSMSLHQLIHDQGYSLESLERPSLHRTGTAQTQPTVSERNTQHPNQPASIVESSPSGPKVSDDATVFSQASKTSVSDTTASSRERKLSTHDGTKNQESLAYAETKSLFSRACFLIRKALELDGVLFVDAFFRDIPVGSADSVATSTSAESLRFRGMPNTPSIDRTEWLNDEVDVAGVPINVFSQQEPLTGSLEIRSSSSELLGHSVKRTSILRSSSSPSGHLALPQSTLRGLLRKFPRGHTFVLDEDGSIVPGVDETHEESISKATGSASNAESDPQRENTWIKQLLYLFPGARSIIFFPLWDPQRDQWFAGSLAWTSDPTRIIQAADVSYLAAFGNSIMSEKSRLDAVNANRAKADFISSVSHELRSPLHGVLASAEALQETSTGMVQDDMIRTIKICGEELLETMDQILDYTKISNSKNVELSSSRQQLEFRPKKTSLDLRDLVETVIEDILIRHTYRQSAFDSAAGKNKSKEEPIFGVASSENVVIILNIDWWSSWNFESEKGGWKRILVNLFGNALKYTNSGFIQVSLHARIVPATATHPAQRVVTLQVDDSGKGMSKDYLKYKAFTPFAQEDQLSLGTGLGLSVVLQLVTNLGGNIDIQSEVGYGTTVKVSVPFELSPPLSDPTPLRSSSLLLDIKRRCKGLTLCLVGFEYYPDIKENPTGILSIYARRMLALKSSFTSIATKWFDLDVSTVSSLVSAKGDILIGLQSKIARIESSIQEQALIIFEDTVGGSRSHDSKGVYYLSQPAGPHKLARVLALCLDWRDTVATPSKINSDTAQTAVPSQNKAHEEMPTLRIADRFSTDLLQDNPAEINQPQLLPLSQAKPDDHNTRGSKVDEIILMLPNNNMPAVSQSIRSKVLLVEDNVINMKILVQYMQKAKQDYITAADGLEALQKFRGNPLSFKVIFMDLSMPVMDGLTSTRYIRMHEHKLSLPRTRVVALTCFSSLECQHDAALSGVDTFLIKPVPMKALKPILDQDPEFPRRAE